MVKRKNGEQGEEKEKDKAAQSFYHPLQLIKEAPGSWQRWRSKIGGGAKEVGSVQDPTGEQHSMSACSYPTN